MTSDGESSKRGSRRAAVIAALVVGSFAVWAVGAEFVLRALGRTPKVFTPGLHFGEEGLFAIDPVTGWVNKPGRYRSLEPGNEWLTVTESGLRGTGTPLPSGGREILIVGASCTQGYGVADDETFTNGLGRAFPDIAFRNLASGGYGTVQSLLAMKRYIDGRGSRPPPLLVIYGFVGRVAAWNVASASWVRQVIDESGRYIVPPHVEFVGGELVFRPGGVVSAWPFESRSALVTSVHEAWLSRRYDASPEEGVRATVDVMAEMAREASDRGSTLLVLLLAEPQPEVEAGLREKGVEVLDCQRTDYETDPSLRVGFHPSRRMHAHWVRCIEAWLEQNLDRL